ncbi:MAG: glycosyltransferase family 4 protein [Candidatus Bathyarchaeota archaeon]|nr:MAG: glycosyltransferase family 4 protein [Candidatus Bathyarchaeota archaeon]
MKAILFTYVFDPCPQSASQRVSSFFQAMVQTGVEVTAVTASRCSRRRTKDSFGETASVYNLNCPRVLISSCNLMPNPLMVFLFLFMGVLLAAGRKVDMLLASVPYGEVAIVGFFLSKIFGIQLVIDMRDLYPSLPELSLANIGLPKGISRFLTRFFLIIYKGSHKIVCVDSDIKERLERLGIAPRKIYVVQNGADISVYKPHDIRERERIRLRYGLPLDRTIFVYAGSLTRYYRVMEAIAGFKTLSGANNLQLLIISYSDSTAHRNFTKNLGLEENVRFMGPLCISDTAQILSSCDVGIVAYGSEDYWKGTYGSKIFSYMSCGLPVLASGPTNSVIESLIREHDIGFFIGNPSKKSFAGGFSFFLTNRRELESMRKRSVEIVRKFYDRKAIGLKLVTLLRKN